MHSLPMYSFLSISLVLYFDGSLRIPKDPNKDIIPTHVSSALSPLATCSTSVMHERNNSIVALGGSNIPYDGMITSADIEYEGLILGLNCLLQMCESKDASVQNDSKVVIRGDCKTVIDQMNGVSMPRKQKIYYNKALLITSKLESEYELTFCFQHVTRDLNELCDGMCKVILHHFLRCATENVLNSIRYVEMEFQPIQLPDNRKKRFKFTETPFHKPLSEITLWSGHVPISLRPYIMCEILLASSRTGDFVAMRLAGKAMYEESQRLHQNSLDLKCADVVRELGLVGMKATYTSLIAMDIQREAEKVAKQISKEYGVDEDLIIKQNLQNLQRHLPLPDNSDDTINLLMTSIASNDEVKKIREWNKNFAQHVWNKNTLRSHFIFFA